MRAHRVWDGMVFRPISQCKRDLSFQPRQSWPEVLPIFCWKDQLLCGFDTSRAQALDLMDEKHGFEEAFVACHPELTLSELARFFSKAEEVLSISWSQLFSFYQLRDSENLRALLKIVATLPMEFQNWISEKNVHARDLQILTVIAEHPLRDAICLKVARSTLSKSLGVQCLEWAGELLLMDFKSESILPENVESDAWHQALYKLRFQTTEKLEQKEKERWLGLPWPSHSEVRWVRHGENSGVELKYKISSPADLDKKIKSLVHIQQMLQSPTHD